MIRGSWNGPAWFSDQEERLRRLGRKKLALERLAAARAMGEFSFLARECFQERAQESGGEGKDRCGHSFQNVSIAAVVQLERTMKSWAASLCRMSSHHGEVSPGEGLTREPLNKSP